MIDPGILELAHKQGIAHLNDMNGDGNINQADLTLALKAKAAVPVIPVTK